MPVPSSLPSRLSLLPVALLLLRPCDPPAPAPAPVRLALLPLLKPCATASAASSSAAALARLELLMRPVPVPDPASSHRARRSLLPRSRRSASCASDPPMAPSWCAYALERELDRVVRRVRERDELLAPAPEVDGSRAPEEGAGGGPEADVRVSEADEGEGGNE